MGAAAGPNEQYLRVRRRGLLVLLMAASGCTPPFTPPQVEPIFRQVLIPQGSSPDASIRDACANIARGVVIALGGGGDGACSEEDILDMACSGVSCLWRELVEALAVGD